MKEIEQDGLSDFLIFSFKTVCVVAFLYALFYVLMYIFVFILTMWILSFAFSASSCCVRRPRRRCGCVF